MNTNKDFMPIAIDIRQKKIVIIGGRYAAYEKLKHLQNYASNITVIDKIIIDEIKATGVQYIEKEYEPSDIEDSFLVYAYTDNHELNHQIKQDGEKVGKLVNVLDNPTIGDFESPVIFEKSNIKIAVSSNGQDISHSRMVVNSIRQIFQHDRFLFPK